MPKFSLDGVDGVEDGTEVEFAVWCTCGRGLCGNTTTTTSRGIPTIVIEPCQNCMSKTEIEGREAGFKDGSAVGYKEGYDKGDADGREAGWNSREYAISLCPPE